MIQRKGVTIGSGGRSFCLRLLLRARLDRALLPVGKVLAQAGSDLCAIRRVAKDLDEAQDLCDASQEAEAHALGPAHRVGVVAQVGVLGVPRDLVLDDGGP